MAENAVNPPGLIELLREHEDRIANAWAGLVHEMPASGYRRRPLQEPQASTARGLRAIRQALEIGSYEALDAYLRDVSLTRLDMGFEIDEVKWRGSPVG